MRLSRIAILCLILLAATSARAAANVKLAWDTKTPADTRTSVRVYEVLTRADSTKPCSPTNLCTYSGILGEAMEPVTTLTLIGVSTGTHVYIARGWNSQQESGDSNTATGIILAPPLVPTTVTITITVQ